MNKKTVIIGATPDPSRYAYRAANMLVKHGHEIIPVGLKKGEVAGKTIDNGQPLIEGVDTVTLYVGPQNQASIYNYLLKLKPKRVIFNPGTENDELMDLLEKNNIEPLEACTLVLLSTNQY
ncbi:MAG TPA: CoA-binding protein [Cytophagaceae bacterium]|nr:CoA-binding protein [Cytophagaceae bacterium]